MSLNKDQTAKVVEQMPGEGEEEEGGGGRGTLSGKLPITTKGKKGDNANTPGTVGATGEIPAKTTTYVFPPASSELVSESVSGVAVGGSVTHPGGGAEPSLSSQQGFSQHKDIQAQTNNPRLTSTTRHSLKRKEVEGCASASSFTSATMGAAFTTRVAPPHPQQESILLNQSSAPSVTLKGIPTTQSVVRGKPPLLKTASLGPGISAFGSEEERQKTIQQQQQQASKSGVLQSAVGRLQNPLPTCSLSGNNKVATSYHQQIQQQQSIDSSGVVQVQSSRIQQAPHHHIHQHHPPHHHQPLSVSISYGGGASVPSGVSIPSAMRLPQKSALKSGHIRSASHGGVIAPTRTIDLSSSTTSTEGTSSTGIPTKPSAMKRGHTRAASQGQIVEDSGGPLKSHSRAPSKTDFILPPGHLEKEKERERSSSNSALRGGTGSGSGVEGIHGPGVGGFRGYESDVPRFPGKGHSRQASRTESIYTLRNHPIPGRSKLFFWRKIKTENSRYRTIVPNHCVAPEISISSDQHPNNKYCNNRICTTKYTAISFLPKNLFEQFHRFANLYFISIVLLNWFPQISAFGKEIAMLPVMFVLGVTAIKDLFEDRRRYNSDKRINNTTCRVWDR